MGGTSIMVAGSGIAVNMNKPAIVNFKRTLKLGFKYDD